MSSFETLWIAELKNRKSPMKVEELAAFLGVSKQKIYKMVALSQIPYLRVNGCIRFVPEQVIEWTNRVVMRSEITVQRRRSA